MSAAEKIEIQAQPGPQTQFLSSEADICIFGGAAGGGKTYAILLEPLRHHSNKDFKAIVFRRNGKQIKNQGGLWSESQNLYPLLGAQPRAYMLDWVFPSGMNLKFDHLEHDSTVLNYQGAQIPLIMFDELTHFSERQFFYMTSRLRSASGVPGYIRATCNPDADSWVRTFIDWWIDEDGYAIPERSGVLRYYLRMGDEIVWGDHPDDLKLLYGQNKNPRSVTFIPSKLSDNQILMKKDPSYLAALEALPLVDRERLLGDEQKGGNWNIRASAGNIFRRSWFEVVNQIPSGFTKVVRFWDRAATKPTPANPDPDWTRGLKLYSYPDGTFVVGDLQSMQDTPMKVEHLIKRVAAIDTIATRVVSQQDPGSAGVAEAEQFKRMLSTFDVRTRSFSKDKLTRAKAVSAASEGGRIKVYKAKWNKAFFDELEAFPEGGHDDIVDVFSGAYNELENMFSTLDLAANGDQS